MSAHQYDHGHTVAGWTGVGIAAVGSALVGVGVCTTSAGAVAGGLAVDVVALLVTWALHLVGWGKPPGRRPREQWPMRARDAGAREGHGGCLGCRLAGRGRRKARTGAGVEAVAGPGATEPVPPAPVG
ncbi:HGxxPAAW family protein [Streptomyces viridiviolaceus]